MSALIEQMQAACAAREPIAITGGGSKAFYAGSYDAQPISTLEHRGIIGYQPEELVITARTGTPLTEIQMALAEQGQMLAFEPPDFDCCSTLGGMIASGFSGLARPWRGSLRDAVLGVKIINGKGESLHFGGQVIKNVAGYDASRLMAGAFGTLGLLHEASIRTAPLPATELTLTLQLAQEPALQKMQQLGRSTLPVSGLSWHDQQLYVRLGGNAASVDAAMASIGGEALEKPSFWQDLNQQQLAFFQTPGNLWRLSLPPATANIALPGEQLLDWGGAQRWLHSDADPKGIQSMVMDAGGHATLFKSSQQPQQAFELPPSLLALHQRLKAAFDPYQLINIERLYKGI